MNNSITYICLLYLCSSTSSAQELTPRAYWPAPNGTMVAVLGYKYSFGDILTDPSLPISGVDSKIHVAFIGYVQTFSLFDRTTNFLIELPYTWATTTGNILGPLGELPGRRVNSGIADIGITISINLIGAPTMDLKGFQELRNNPRQILGASLKILAPTGAYEQDKLINIGSNRWAFKSELGYMIPLEEKWLLELEAGMWFFTNNDKFIGQTRKQEPIYASQLHLVKRFIPGFWAALNVNFFWGGRSNLLEEDLKRNSKFGVTIVYPFCGRHSLKGGFNMGLVTESGENFKSFLIAYQLLLN
ncbi:MAG: transporter [Ignavibacteriaceae bacterium]